MIKEKFMGVNVCTSNMQETITAVNEIIELKEPSFVVAINPEKLMKANVDENLKQLLNSATLQIPDGIGVVLASKLNGGKIKSRVTGIDLMNNICELANNKNYRIFMLGGKPGVAIKAAEILKEKHKNINIVGIIDGYFENENDVVEKIIATRADILFVALGSPRQEYFITKNLERLKVPLCMGVGGSYDVICGNIKRAPKWMCNTGLEWLYRLIKEPWRCKRMLSLPIFLMKVVSERMKK